MPMSKNWLITGASSGIGRLLTEKALQRGDSVLATLRRMDALDDLGRLYPERLITARMDLTEADAIRNTVDRAFAELGRIDVVVNNGGYGLFGAGEEVTSEQIRHQIDTNLIGSMEVIRAALPHLRAQGGGLIQQVASEGGQITYPNFSVYHASKWGIEGFVDAVAKEVAPFGIRFTIVEPGPTRTNFAGGLVSPAPMAAYENTPAGQLRRDIADGKLAVNGDPDKMAEAMIAYAELENPPLRLALGSVTYGSIKAALQGRLAELEAHKATTLAMDIDE
jgi:NAD(P)-dependent dehydrogenase (short-subunit alcohol dehydrogenase family)